MIPSQYRSANEYVLALCDFLQSFEKLMKSSSVDFFSDCLESLLPEGWIAALMNLPDEMLARLAVDTAIQSSWPPTLVLFLKTARSLHLVGNEQKQKLAPLTVKQAGAKKQHEVSALAPLVAFVCQNAHVSDVLDVGSGQGYLSLELAVSHKLRVVGVDMDVRNTSGALRRRDLHQRMARLASPIPFFPITGRISDSADGAQLADLYCRHSSASNLQSSSIAHESVTCPSIGIVGLHTCGDLAVSLLRAFTQHENLGAVVCVGCCYNLLSEQTATGASGSPKSKPFSDQLNHPELLFAEPIRSANCLPSSSGTQLEAIETGGKQADGEGHGESACKTTTPAAATEMSRGFPLSALIRRQRPHFALDRGGRRLACEATCKLDSTLLSSRELWQALLDVVLRAGFGFPPNRPHLNGLDTGRRRIKVGRLASPSFVTFARQALASLFLTNLPPEQTAPPRVGNSASIISSGVENTDSVQLSNQFLDRKGRGVREDTREHEKNRLFARVPCEAGAGLGTSALAPALYHASKRPCLRDEALSHPGSLPRPSEPSTTDLLTLHSSETAEPDSLRAWLDMHPLVHPDSDEALDGWLRALEGWAIRTGGPKKLACFVSLRAVLAPLAEALILADRLVFLQEASNSSALCRAASDGTTSSVGNSTAPTAAEGPGSIECALLPVFDPALSPRHIAVVAWRAAAAVGAAPVSADVGMHID